MINFSNKVGVVAAHPDDELLGMGGTLKRLAATNTEIAVLFLSSGVGARAVLRESPESRKAAAFEALMTLGISDISFADFPDNQFGTVPKLSIIKCVEDFLQKNASTSVFTNSRKDLNEDHQITAEATLVACRPTPTSEVEGLYHFETLSSSEWNFEFASPLERVEPALWNFVGCTSMTIKVVAQRFDHHALRRRNAAQHCQFVFIQGTGICMWQQTSFFQHKRCHFVQVVHG